MFDVAALYDGLTEYENSFEAHYQTDWMIEYADIPFYATGIYLVILFYGQQWMSKREKPLNLRPLLVVWNLLLALFSICGILKIGPTAYRTLVTEGYHYTLCSPSYNWWNKGPVGAWVGLFAVSKVPELIDTVFLVLQKKPVIFLHWYHHITVMLYCWLAYPTYNSAGIWYGTMNYFVHSIMYSYYFMMSASNITRVVARPFAKFITTLQIAQMVGGLYCAMAVQYYFAQPEGCVGVVPVANRSALVMYLTYFVLFGKFFLDNYVWKVNAKRNREAGSGVTKAKTA